MYFSFRVCKMYASVTYKVKDRACYYVSSCITGGGENTTFMYSFTVIDVVMYISSFMVHND